MVNPGPTLTSDSPIPTSTDENLAENNSSHLEDGDSYLPDCMHSQEFSIAFVAHAIDAVGTVPNIGSCHNLLVAVADVFGTLDSKVTPDMWESLFLQTKSEHDDEKRQTLLKLIMNVFCATCDNGEHSSMYKDGCIHLISICNSKNFQRNFFARYLCKLVDAKFGFPSKSQRRRVLGWIVVNLGKLTHDFPNTNIWKKMLTLPERFRSNFLDPLVFNWFAGGGEHYETDDESDDEPIEKDNNIQQNYFCKGEGRENLKTHESNIDTFEDLNRRFKSIDAKFVALSNTLQNAANESIASMDIHYEDFKNSVGVENSSKIIEKLSHTYKQLQKPNMYIDPYLFTIEIGQILGFGEDKLRTKTYTASQIATIEI